MKLCLLSYFQEIKHCEMIYCMHFSASVVKTKPEGNHVSRKQTSYRMYREIIYFSWYEIL